MALCSRLGARLLALLALTVVTSCSGSSPAAPAARTAPAVAHPALAPVANPVPTPALPAYAIESLRARRYDGGRLAVGLPVGGTAVYTVRPVSWPSQGGTMTGLAVVPTGPGPFPVVIVNHGFIPAPLYRVGADSLRYAEAFAAGGILAVAPDYPGYAGSSPAEPDLVPIEAEAVAGMDLIGSLSSLPQADTRRVAVAGHSNGGGVAELMMVIDPRIRAAVLYAPVSTDMADNARRWWTRHEGGTGPLGSPDRDPAAYASISPRTHLRPGGPPVLILQGDEDEDIPAEWTAATVAALRSSGVHTRFVSFPGARHSLAGADLDRANTLAVEWMRTAFS